MKENSFNVEPQYKNCPLQKEFKSSIRFEFESGDEKKKEKLQEKVCGKSVKYAIEFDFWRPVSPNPLTLTIWASTYSTASQELITFKEKRTLTFGARTTLELTLGAGYLHVNGWATTILDSKLKNITTPPNFAYNTTICVQTLLPAMVKSESHAIELQMKCDGRLESRQYGISTALTSAISVQSYLFNLFDNTIKVKSIAENDRSRHCSSFFVKPNKSIDFDITIANNRQSVIQF